MFDKWTQYSYAEQKKQRHRLLKFIFVFLILYILFNCFNAFLFSSWVVENNTMQPGLSSGDRLIFTSFSPPWIRDKSDNNNLMFKRGSIVLVDMGRQKEKKIPLKILDGIVRFFTLQTVSIFSGEGQYYIKRVIGLPGDEISMSNYVFKVRTAGSSYSLTEYELSEKPYLPFIPQTSDLWNEQLPFSGSMDAILLGPGECFVISDDRSNTNDSRTWGSVKVSSITSRAVLKFWPVLKMELF
ncbi:MAG: signal peptidase I [Treponema sp.]|nr:signal peptidase I [Treponema sp.]